MRWRGCALPTLCRRAAAKAAHERSLSGGGGGAPIALRHRLDRSALAALGLLLRRMPSYTSARYRRHTERTQGKQGVHAGSVQTPKHRYASRHGRSTGAACQAASTAAGAPHFLPPLPTPPALPFLAAAPLPLGAGASLRLAPVVDDFTVTGPKNASMRPAQPALDRVGSVIRAGLAARGARGSARRGARARTLVGLAARGIHLLDRLADALLAEALLPDQELDQAVHVRRAPLERRQAAAGQHLWLCAPDATRPLPRRAAPPRMRRQARPSAEARRNRLCTARSPLLPVPPCWGPGPARGAPLQPATDPAP